MTAKKKKTAADKTPNNAPKKASKTRRGKKSAFKFPRFDPRRARREQEAARKKSAARQAQLDALVQRAMRALEEQARAQTRRAAAAEREAKVREEELKVAREARAVSATAMRILTKATPVFLGFIEQMDKDQKARVEREAELEKERREFDKSYGRTMPLGGPAVCRVHPTERCSRDGTPLLFRDDRAGIVVGPSGLYGLWLCPKCEPEAEPAGETPGEKGPK